MNPNSSEIEDRFSSQELINASIRDVGFSESTIQLINNYINDILYGRTNLTRFNLSEHAGLCCAGAPLIGAYIVCHYARTSLKASADVTESQGEPANWEIECRDTPWRVRLVFYRKVFTHYGSEKMEYTNAFCTYSIFYSGILYTYSIFLMSFLHTYSVFSSEIYTMQWNCPISLAQIHHCQSLSLSHPQLKPHRGDTHIKDFAPSRG